MNVKNRLLILLDWQPPEDWPYIDPFKAFFDKIIVQSMPTPKGYNSTLEKIVSLWRIYLLGAWRAFRKSGKVDVVLSLHAVIGLILAFFCRISFRRSPQIVIAQLIEPDRPATIYQRLRKCFVSYALGRVDLVIVHSTIEVEVYKKRFKNGKTRFCFVPLGIDFSQIAIKDSLGYIFSGGRSNRDYRTLLRAIEKLDVRVEIVAQRFNIDEKIPENANIQYGVFGQKFDRLIAESAIVVVLLDRPDESSGQLVMLQAMAHGKPVVVTQNRGLFDYIEPGKNAVTVPPHDAEELKRVLFSLSNDPQRRADLGKHAREHVKQFTIEKTAMRIAKQIAQLD